MAPFRYYLLCVLLICLAHSSLGQSEGDDNVMMYNSNIIDYCSRSYIITDIVLVSQRLAVTKIQLCVCVCVCVCVCRQRRRLHSTVYMLWRHL